LRLASDEVHIWRVWLDDVAAPAEYCERILSEDELERADRFHFDRDRRRFVVGRGLLRMILARYVHIPPAEFFFFYGHHGKPRLTPTRASASLHFNVSHSGGLALYAVTRDCELGIDVERVRPMSDADQIAASYFSAREQRQWMSLSSAQQEKAFFKFWTCKEACLKAEGGGLAESMKQLEIFENPPTEARTFASLHFSGPDGHWAVAVFEPSEGYSAALAVKGPDERTAQESSSGVRPHRTKEPVAPCFWKWRGSRLRCPRAA
jgi:4'-phosphopantetheinyl transferase